MLSRIRSRLTYANVVATVALFFALTTGGAYAAIRITGANIVNGTVTGVDLKNDTITGAKVKDFSLKPKDSGILFAQVDEDGTVTRASKGTKVTRLDQGQYEVTFSRKVSNGTFIASAVRRKYYTPPNVIITLADRSGNRRAVFVRIRDESGAKIDSPFHLVVIL